MFEWFSFNNLKSNASKCHLFLFPYFYQPFSVNIRGSNSFNKLKSNASNFHLFFSPYQPVPVNIRGSIIESSNYEKLLGIYTQRVTFHSNIIQTEFAAKQGKNFLDCLRLQNTLLQIKNLSYSNLHNFTIQLLSNTLHVPRQRFE